MKLKITNKQYQKIIIHEQNSRLSIINEGKDEKTISYDDLKVLLTLGKIIGLPLSGQNLHIAEKNIKNEAVLSKIKDIVEDEDRLYDIIDQFNEKGMRSADELLSKNAENIVKEFNKITSELGINKKLDFLAKHRLKELKTTK